VAKCFEITMCMCVCVTIENVLRKGFACHPGVEGWS